MAYIRSKLQPELVRIITGYMYGDSKISGDNVSDIKFFAGNAFLQVSGDHQCSFCEKMKKCELYNIFNISGYYQKLYGCDDCENNAYKYCLLAERASILKSSIIVTRSDNTFSFATLENICRKSQSIFSNKMICCMVDENKYVSMKNLMENISQHKSMKNSNITKMIYHHDLIDTMSNFLNYYL